MLKNRIYTFIMLVLGLPTFICYVDSQTFVYGCAALGLVCAYEWLHLIPLERLGIKISYLLFFVLLMGVQVFVPKEWMLSYYFYGYSVVWSFIIVALLRYPKGQWWHNKSVKILLSYATLLLTGLSLIALREEAGKKSILLLLLIVMLVDTMGFLAGRFLGKRALAPSLSPKKTQEGAIIGIVTAVILISYIRLGGMTYQLVDIIPLALWISLVAIVAIAGDLFVSMMKRHVHLKDTGSFLPGHGGILDRADSLIATAPLFYYLYAMKLI